MSNPPSEHIVCFGQSMKPTLAPLDLIRVLPYAKDKIHLGDVVLFISPKDNRKIAHRVIAFDQKKIKTKGDHNKMIDSWNLYPKDIIGRVICVKRGVSWQRVPGGILGFLYACSAGLGFSTISFTFTLLHPAYKWLEQKGLFRHLFFKSQKKSVVRFYRGSHVELQLYLGRRLIGRKLPKEKNWLIKRPFRLFIDESSLPKN